MEAYQLRQIIALVLAAAAAFMTYRLARTLKFERGAAARVSGMLTTEQKSLFDRYGEKYVRARPVSLADNLRLAQLAGRYVGWTVGGVIARSLAYGGLALAYLLLTRPGPVFWLLAPLAAYYPIMRVSSAADEARRMIQRSLPEAATVLAAEMAAGASPEQALIRAAGIPGPLGTILSQAVAETRRSARPAFSRGTAEGVVLEALSAYNLPSLTRFALQLDRVAEKGVEAPRVIGEVARGFAREYRAQVQQAAASLDNQLLAPMTLFFFFPFLVAMLLPLMLALFGAFQ
jgi:Flp pilus assembly protein TadB